MRQPLSRPRTRTARRRRQFENGAVTIDAAAGGRAVKVSNRIEDYAARRNRASGTFGEFVDRALRPSTIARFQLEDIIARSAVKRTVAAEHKRRPWVVL